MTRKQTLQYDKERPYKIHIRLGELDTATLWRVRNQIIDTAPEWCEISTALHADAQIILAIGATGLVQAVKERPTILLQLCLKTTEVGIDWWKKMWKRCLMVGSYYDLPNDHNYVRFPMGYDGNVFKQTNFGPRKYKAILFGEMDGPEEISSVYNAFRKVAHVSVGTGFDLGFGYVKYTNIPDKRLAEIYNDSEYCIGLRRVEGFEMPIIEGAACGCKPITFDYECYSHWFQGMAYFIKDDKSIVDQLKEIDGDSVQLEPNARLIERFEQKTAWKPFWDKLDEVVNG